MKRIISTILAVTFTMSNIGYAGELRPSMGNANLAPAVISGALGDENHKKAAIAEIVAEAILKRVLGQMPAEELIEPGKVEAKLRDSKRLFTDKELKENTDYDVAEVSPCWRGIEHIAHHIYKAPLYVIKKGIRWDCILLFSTKKNGEFFPITTCTAGELDTVMAAIRAGIMPVRNERDRTAMSDYAAHEKYDRNVTQWAHIDPHVRPRIITLLTPAEQLPYIWHVLEKAGIADEHSYDLSIPIYIVPVTPELKERIQANQVWVTAEDGTRRQIPAYASTSNRTRHIYLEEDLFEAFIRADENGRVKILMKYLPHEIGVSLGCKALRFEDGKPVNEIDDRYAHGYHGKKRFTLANLDIVAGRDFAAADAQDEPQASTEEIVDACRISLSSFSRFGNLVFASEIAPGARSPESGIIWIFKSAGLKQQGPNWPNSNAWLMTAKAHELLARGEQGDLSWLKPETDAGKQIKAYGYILKQIAAELSIINTKKPDGDVDPKTLFQACHSVNLKKPNSTDYFYLPCGSDAMARQQRGDLSKRIEDVLARLTEGREAVREADKVQPAPAAATPASADAANGTSPTETKKEVEFKGAALEYILKELVGEGADRVKDSSLIPGFGINSTLFTEVCVELKLQRSTMFGFSDCFEFPPKLLRADFQRDIRRLIAVYREKLGYNRDDAESAANTIYADSQPAPAAALKTSPSALPSDPVVTATPQAGPGFDAAKGKKFYEDLILAIAQYALKKLDGKVKFVEVDQLQLFLKNRIGLNCDIDTEIIPVLKAIKANHFSQTSMSWTISETNTRPIATAIARKEGYKADYSPEKVYGDKWGKGDERLPQQEQIQNEPAPEAATAKPVENISSAIPKSLAEHPVPQHAAESLAAQVPLSTPPTASVQQSQVPRKFDIGDRVKIEVINYKRDISSLQTAGLLVKIVGTNITGFLPDRESGMSLRSMSIPNLERLKGKVCDATVIKFNPRIQGEEPEPVFSLMPPSRIERELGGHSNRQAELNKQFYPAGRPRKPWERRPPKGSSATLLRQMFNDKVFADDPKKSADMALKRGGNDSPRNIQRELRVLQALKIVEGDEDGYYLAGWVRDGGAAIVDRIIKENPELDRAEPSKEELRAVEARLIETAEVKVRLMIGAGPSALLGAGAEADKDSAARTGQVNPFFLFERGDRGNTTIDDKTVIIGTGGGDCAGLNDTIAQLVRNFNAKGYKVLGIRNCFEGMLSDDWEKKLIEFTPETVEVIAGLPSTVIRSCRKKLEDADLARICERFRGAAGIIITGGNDHLKEAEKISEFSARKGTPIVTVGIPKSVDNDFNTAMLGFRSACLVGRKIASRASVDPKSGDGKTVAVFEIMGRKSGSLTLESSHGCRYPKAVILPEKMVKVTIDDIVEAANAGIRNFFVSEGFSLDESDPKFKELLANNPMLNEMYKKAKVQKAGDKKGLDPHGNVKLTGASLYVVGILEHFCKENITKIERTDITYEIRGLSPQKGPGEKEPFELFLAKKFAEQAAYHILSKSSELALSYPSYEDRDSSVMSLPAEYIYRSKDLSEWLERQGRDGLAHLGILGIEGVRPATEAEPFVKQPANALSAKYEARRLFYSIGISTLAHKGVSCVEMRLPPGAMIAACSSVLPPGEFVTRDLEIVIDAVKDSVMVLTSKEYVSFSEIADKVKRAHKACGCVNVAVSSDFKLKADDPVLKDILKESPILNARFNRDKIDAGGGFVRFDSGVSNFIVGLFEHIKAGPTRITDLGYAFREMATEEPHIGAASDAEIHSSLLWFLREGAEVERAYLDAAKDYGKVGKLEARALKVTSAQGRYWSDVFDYLKANCNDAGLLREILAEGAGIYDTKDEASVSAFGEWKEVMKGRIAGIVTALTAQKANAGETPVNKLDKATQEALDAALKLLPEEYLTQGFDDKTFVKEVTEVVVPKQKVEIDDGKCALIFSEKLVFDDGLGILLPKLADARIKIVVIAPDKKQKDIIDILNIGKPKDKQIVCADNIAEAPSKAVSELGAVRFLYFRDSAEASVEGMPNIPLTSETIIRLIGKVCNIVDDTLIKQMKSAAEAFAQAA